MRRVFEAISQKGVIIDGLDEMRFKTPRMPRSRVESRPTGIPGYANNVCLYGFRWLAGSINEYGRDFMTRRVTATSCCTSTI